MYPIGPITGRTLFQILAEQVLSRSRRAGQPIPYFIMTSDATHDATVSFFEDHSFFGLGRENVYFFKQGVLPAVDASSSKILLSEPGVISTSPDGHGGMLKALQTSGLLEEMSQRGIEHLYYHQVDNPTAIVCDPVFLGEHLRSGSEMSTKVVAKTGPEERMGVVVEIDGKTQIIEYSDLTAEEAARRDQHGNYIFWAGNTAMHVFRLQFLTSLLETGNELPYHIAHKAVPHVTEEGELVSPPGNQPNAHKFEQFIFEADRQREFNPVKNSTGADSPETSRRALNAISRQMLLACGAHVSAEINLEVSPLYALDEMDLAGKVLPGTQFEADTVLGS
jgi:UDP-N-acetylglucosamine/UDP-N-acetylgalactosamine diphosphorylase